MNGDILTNLDYRALSPTTTPARAVLTIGLHQKDVKIDLGIIKTDAHGRVDDYIEKPTLHYGVSMGIYVYDEEVLSPHQAGRVPRFPVAGAAARGGGREGGHLSQRRLLARPGPLRGPAARLGDLHRASARVLARGKTDAGRGIAGKSANRNPKQIPIAKARNEKMTRPSTPGDPPAPSPPACRDRAAFGEVSAGGRGVGGEGGGAG